jgi:hypothetical protein
MSDTQSDKASVSEGAKAQRSAAPWRRGRRRRSLFLWDVLLGLLLGALVYLALGVLPSLTLALLELTGGRASASLAVPRLASAVLVAALYVVSPLSGGGAALMTLLVPVAAYNLGLAGAYALFGLLALPSLRRRGGVFLFAFVPLALAYPELALLLPCLPVLAGLLYGRLGGIYGAALLAVALIVLGLVAGQAAVGVVHIGGDSDPLMESGGIAVAADVTLVPEELLESDLAESLQEAREEGDLVALLSLASAVVFQWWMPRLAAATLAVLWELQPRMLGAPLIVQVAGWAAIGGGVAWWVRREEERQRRRAAAVALAGVIVTVVLHALVLPLWGAPPPAPTQAVSSALASIFVGVVIAVPLTRARVAG